MALEHDAFGNANGDVFALTASRWLADLENACGIAKKRADSIFREVPQLGYLGGGEMPFESGHRDTYPLNLRDVSQRFRGGWLGAVSP